MRLPVWQHEDDEGLARLASPLRALGIEPEVRLRDPREEDVGAPALVVLGGGLAAYDPGSTLVLRERALLAERLARGLPTVGICLGSQLLALAAGGRGWRGERGAEIGASEVRWTDAGRAEPLLAGLPEPLLVPQWHGDTFDLPEREDVAWLAEGAVYRAQAFRVGRSYGFQFHLELDGAALRAWGERLAGELAGAGLDRAHVEAAAGALPAAEAHLDALTQRVARYLHRALSGGAATLPGR